MTRSSMEQARRDAAFYLRLGRLMDEMPRFKGDALMSRAIQVARTWRSDFAWRLANALGWQR